MNEENKKNYLVSIEGIELKNVSTDDVEEFKINQAPLINKFNGTMDIHNGDAVEYRSESEHSTKEEALERFNFIKNAEQSIYLPCNKLLKMRKVVLEEVTYDEDNVPSEYEYIDSDFLDIDF